MATKIARQRGNETRTAPTPYHSKCTMHREHCYQSRQQRCGFHVILKVLMFERSATNQHQPRSESTSFQSHVIRLPENMLLFPSQWSIFLAKQPGNFICISPSTGLRHPRTPSPKFPATFPQIPHSHLTAHPQDTQLEYSPYPAQQPAPP